MTAVRLTYRFRLRDKHAPELARQARAVNFVWNYLNETQQKAAQAGRKWLSDAELQRLTSGSGAMLGLRAQTVCRICRQYVTSRKRFNRPWLRFRGWRSLGWVPLHAETLRFDGRSFLYMGMTLQPMHWRPIPEGAKVCDSSLSQDAKGKWYLNLTLQIACEKAAPHQSIGIDLGLKYLATLSDGRKFGAPRFYRESELTLVKAQRARKSKQARAINTKVANRRRDFLHKLSKQLTDEFVTIVVGDVSPTELARTRLAKSIYDAGWSDLKRMLSYKSIRNGGTCLEVSERLTTQTCSECGSLPPSRPRGIAGLSKRIWECDCGVVHDRDVNAARNILRLGLETLSGGAARMRSSQISRGVRVTDGAER